jgi:membrane-bound lytic murein transglycosylase D
LADEIIAGAVSIDESLESDPLLQDYLRQLRSAPFTAEILERVTQSASPDSLKHINDAYPFIREVLAKYDLPAELAAVVVVESAGNASALSPKGALGLWQLMPDTARRYGLRVDRVADDRLDPVKATYAAARYLRDLYAIFRDWPLALAAYNAGENRIQKVIQKAGIQQFAELASRQLLPAETAHYVPAVLALMQLDR